MPQNAARIFTRVMDWADPDGTPVDGVEKIRVEWALLHGSRAKGKSIFVFSLTSKNRLASDIIDALLVELNTRFQSADYRTGDVILWGA